MNAGQIFVAGIAPDHVPALCAAVLVPILVLGHRYLSPRLSAEFDAADFDPDATVSIRLPASLPTRVFGWLMAISAAVHLALPLGHHDNGALTVAFLASGVAYGWLAYRAVTGRRYRTLSVPLILATIIAYLVMVLRGDEGPDQVGIATLLVELAALGLCLVAEPEPDRPESAALLVRPKCRPTNSAALLVRPKCRPTKRVRRVFGSIGLVFVTVLAGALTWGATLAQHAADGAGGIPGGQDHHGHDHAAGVRGQAGVLMPRQSATVPTPDEVRGAADLAGRTKRGLARYTDIRNAFAAGYRVTLTRTGYSVHLENKAYSGDRQVLDPERPEQLMYAIADGRATLLSAVYTVPYAGMPAPTPGGPLTHWHSHNVCITVLPPGWTVVDAYGGCPPFAVQLAIPLMMHVWVVDNPGGPYADGVPDTWTRAFNRAHGVPFHW